MTWNIGLLVSSALPFPCRPFPFRVLCKDEIPQEFEVLPMQALRDNKHPIAQLQVGDLLVSQTVRPFLEPSQGIPRSLKCMEQHTHDVRFTLSALADEYDGASRVRPNRFNRVQYIARGVGDLQERLCRNLNGTGLVLVRQFDGRPLEAATFEFIS